MELTKESIRQSLLKKRNALGKEEISARSSIIKENLFSLAEYKSAKNIMAFVSFNNEVHTHNIIKETLKAKIVIVPKVIEHKIEPILISDFDLLIPMGKFNILEPMENIFFNKKKIELVVVAGIAFDRKGHRIGYGFGYFDKFLSTVPNAKKIGLAFDFQIVDMVPSDKHDVPVDIIVTDKEIIKC